MNLKVHSEMVKFFNTKLNGNVTINSLNECYSKNDKLRILGWDSKKRLEISCRLGMELQMVRQ